MTMRNIISPMPTGNGAYVVHRMLEKGIPGYTVMPYRPLRELFPPSLLTVGRFTRAHLIHTTSDYAIFHVRKDVPVVVTFHHYVIDRFMKDYSSPLRYFHYRTDLRLFTGLAVKCACAVTAVSRFTAGLVKRDLSPRSGVRVIYNGVDHNRFVPAKRKPSGLSGEIRVLFCGNLTSGKGIQWLAPIAERLEPGIKIFFTSGLRPSWLRLDHPRLIPLGPVSHDKMHLVYQDFDMLLFPSVREAFGLVAAEAMACGLPVVATNCSSIPELVDDGRGGFLCPLGNVDDFAEKITHLAHNPSMRREMGQYNRDKVERMFTAERMVGEYRALFSGLLS